MAKVALLRPGMPPDRRALPEPEAPAWERLPEGARRVAGRRAALVRHLAEGMARGLSATRAVEHLLAALAERRAPATLAELALSLGRGGKPPSRATLLRWLAEWDAEAGAASLAPGYAGRARRTYG